MRTPLIPLATIVVVALSACGQKGPLYLPQGPAAPAATSATGTHSHGQPASARKDEAKEDPSQQPSEQHTEAEAVTK
ncbi:LPS translocon maturation chaperone LptM [Microbulbifer pacificus]|uniref:LPS translocon maturation chaperone LptM n=1 Tax=Microbulbifer pacificus TaxID=407164 RepID=UPI000CF50139|nr:lipoprotein [Microbulbifer pacificus]